jgi:hypothetical protein
MDNESSTKRQVDDDWRQHQVEKGKVGGMVQ